MKDGVLHWQTLFPSLASGDPETRSVMEDSQLVRIPVGQQVFHVGSPCSNYVLLLEGSVRVQVIGESGREALLYRVLPGQSCVLTTCCILSGESYPAEGFTEAPVQALSISKSAFDAALGAAPSFRQFVFVNLGGRIADVIARMEEVAFQPVDHRLATYLLSRVDGNACINATHQEMAAELGTAREVVSRHLKRLESGNIIELGRSVVKIRDFEALQAVVDSPL